MGQRIAVPIALYVGERMPKDPDHVRQAVEGYVRSLLDALQIPADPDIELVGGRPADLPSGKLRFIAQRESSNLLRRDAGGVQTAESAAQMACLALFGGRSLLVTDEVAAAVWGEWGGGDVGAAPPGFAQALRTVVRCGMAVGSLRAAIGKVGSSGEPPDAAAFDAAVERALETRGGPVVRLALGSALYSRCFDPDTGEAVPVDGEGRPITEMLSMMSDGLFYMLGLVFSVVTEADASLDPFAFSVSWYDVPGPRISGLEDEEVLVNEVPYRLLMLNVQAREAVNPANGSACAIVRGEHDARVCEASGYTTWSTVSYVVLCASVLVRRGAAAFIDTRFTRLYLARLAEAFPTLVHAADERFDRDLITRVLRYLVDEEISIRDSRGILEGLLSVHGVCTVDQSKYIVFDPHTGRRCPVPVGKGFDDLGAGDYAEAARAALRDYVSHKHTQGAGALVVFLLDPDIETDLQAAEGAAPECRREIIDAVHAEMSNLYASRTTTPVILTTVLVRKPMRSLIEAEFPELAVLSYQELSPEMNIQPIARISVE